MEQSQQGSLSPEDKQIRKLRKKLREIERLEITDRDLNEDELIKVNSKVVIRRELRSLLKDIHPDEADIMKRQGFSVDDSGVHRKRSKNSVDIKSEPVDEFQHDPDTSAFPSLSDTRDVYKREPCLDKPSDSNVLHNNHLQDQGKSSSVSSQRDHSAQNKASRESTPKTASAAKESDRGQSKQGKEKQVRSVWRDSSYQVFTLEGHNDIVLSVDCTDEYVISASRDTTVKVWRVCETKEERSLRGHTAAVTAVVFLPDILAATVLRKFVNDPESMPPAHCLKSPDCRVLAVSGSLDCTIRVWDVQTGESFGSMYTYNGITVMKCGTWGVVTGTEGGKLEIWCITTGQRLAFVNAFQFQVTALHVDGEQIYAGSSEGDAGIWRYNSHTKSISAVFIMEFESQSFVPLRRLSAVVGREGLSYYGDSGPNIKVLDWKTGNVTRLVNHVGDIGMTDSLAVSPDGHLLSSSYFVDTGCSSINVRELASGKYVCSLIDEDEGRFLSMSSAAGIIVTGGHLLKVWLQGEKRNIPKKSKTHESEIIYPNVLRKLSSRAVESASEDDTDWASSSDDDDGRPRTHMPGGASGDCPETESSWWCNIL